MKIRRNTFPFRLNNILWLVVFLSLHASKSKAQLNTGELAIGGDTLDWGSSLLQTPDKGFIIAGTTDPDYLKTHRVSPPPPPNPRPQYAYLLKLDSTGTLIWKKTFDMNHANCVIQTHDGGLLLSGYYYFYPPPNYEETDMPVLVKLDKNENIQYSIEGVGGTSAATSLTETSEKKYIVAGGCAGVYVCELDSAFTPKWGETINTDSLCGTSGGAAVQTYDKGFAVAGCVNTISTPNFDMYAVKLDSSGNLKWEKTIGGSNDDFGTAIVQTYDKGLAIAGYTNSFGAGGYDFYVVKLDSAGNLLWTKTIGGKNDEQAYSMVESNDNGLVIVGYTLSYGANPGIAKNVYVVKLDSAGNLKWTRTIGGTKGEIGNAIIQTSDKGFAITGSTASYGIGYFSNVYFLKLDSMGNLCHPLISDSGRVGSGGIEGTGGSATSGIDTFYFAATIQDTGGIVTDICGIPSDVDNLPFIGNEMLAEPNPFHDYTYLNFTLPQNENNTTLRITDMFGRVITTITGSYKQGVNSVKINGSSLAPGCYFYELVTSRGNYCGKMVKVN